MLKVKVNTYKESGKWNTDYELEVDAPIYDSDAIESAIEKAVMYAAISNYTFYAVDSNGALNHRLVINKNQ